MIAFYYQDTNIVYEIQAAGTLTQGAIGDQYDVANPTAGSTSTGLSSAAMSTSAAGSGATNQLRVINLAPYPDNAWGDAYPIVQVQIALSQYVAAINAI